MREEWVIDTSCGLSAEAIMTKDKERLEKISLYDTPLLHLYEWRAPSITFGYFIEPKAHLCLSSLKACHIETSRRPTGGGIMFHFCDFSFSLLVPVEHHLHSLSPLESYEQINTCVSQALKPFLQKKHLIDFLPVKNGFDHETLSFCMAKPTPFDLMIAEKKMGGAAQRRTKKGMLHQCSILLCPLSQNILEKVVKCPQKRAMIYERSQSLLEKEPCENELTEIKRHLRDSLIKSLCLIGWR